LLWSIVYCLTIDSSYAEEKVIKLKPKKISDSVYVINSLGTNVGILVGSESLIIIDPAINDRTHSSFVNAIENISDKPVNYIINTHHHGDHSAGNKYFADRGAMIVSQSNAHYLPKHLTRRKHDYNELIFDNKFELNITTSSACYITYS
jgi:cyclase